MYCCSQIKYLLSDFHHFVSVPFGRFSINRVEARASFSAYPGTRHIHSLGGCPNNDHDQSQKQRSEHASYFHGFLLAHQAVVPGDVHESAGGRDDSGDRFPNEFPFQGRWEGPNWFDLVHSRRKVYHSYMYGAVQSHSSTGGKRSGYH